LRWRAARRVLGGIAHAYIELFRNLPLLFWSFGYFLSRRC
jgi:ABC-type amino acid transport system permease subunit